MPRRYPPEMRRQVIELARSGTRVKQLAVTFAISEATVYNWTNQDKIDRGERGTEHRPGDRVDRRQASHRAARDRAGGVAEGQRGVPQPAPRPKSLYAVIEALTGQGIDFRHSCRTLGALAPRETAAVLEGSRPGASAAASRQVRERWLSSSLADTQSSINQAAMRSLTIA